LTREFGRPEHLPRRHVRLARFAVISRPFRAGPCRPDLSAFLGAGCAPNSIRASWLAFIQRSKFDVQRSTFAFEFRIEVATRGISPILPAFMELWQTLGNLHPKLVQFPLVLLLTGLIFDAIGLMRRDRRQTRGLGALPRRIAQSIH
jgi:hypothetical protein